jgi:hypothetical protein
LPLDILEFFCLMPLPGSEDHRTLWRSGVALDGDLDKYDLEHVCAPHLRMSVQEWQAIYREAWSLYSCRRRGFGRERPPTGDP